MINTHYTRLAAEYHTVELNHRSQQLNVSGLARLHGKPGIVVIDVSVWFWVEERKGRGAHLHEALNAGSAIVGIAKTKFKGASYWAAQVLRGSSESPVFVTAAGLAIEEAVAGVKRMHGEHRIPTLAGRADRLARDALRDAGDIR